VARKLITFLPVLLPLLLASRPARAATNAQVQDAIDRATAYLFSQQNPSGTWETGTAPDAGKPVYDTAGGQWGGLTALATYALLADGQNPHDQRLATAIRFLQNADMRGVYALGLRAQVWNYFPNEPWLHTALQRDGRLLLNGLKTYPGAAGMYGYLADPQPGDPDHPFDHSVSQYGVLGMWALEEMGLEVPDQYWALVDSAWRRDQLPDGSWSYFPRPQRAWPESVTLTAAGVASLYITDEYLRQSPASECRDDLNDGAIEHGLSWIAANFDSIFDPPNRACYALYGIERIGAASGRTSFGGKPWFNRGTDFLIDHQSAAGAWDQGDGPVADTALGLLFLVRARAPVIMNKLDYSSANGAVGESAWDRRPRDVAHLSRWISQTIELRRPLNWQVVDLSGDSEDWHEAPILLICGRDALQFSDEQQAKLRRFIEDGGLILFNADCAKGTAFSNSARELGRRMFDTDFRELPADHPIYVNEQFHRNRWAHPPSVLGLSNGAREMMLLIPDADLSAAWQVNSPLTHPEEFQLGADIFLYAIDKEHLRFKGDSYLVKADMSAVTTRIIKLARLHNGPGTDPEPGGWRRLAAIMRNQGGVDLQVTDVDAGDGSLAIGGFTVAHLTGTRELELSDAARREIAAFVSGGGTLIVDAAGGSRAFAESARAELGEIFGDAARQLDRPLRIEDPIYSAGDQMIHGRDIQYRPYARLVLSDVKQPRLRGIRFGGTRTGVYFSAEDLSVGLVGQPVDGIVGYQPDLATKLMERMILASGTP